MDATSLFSARVHAARTPDHGLRRIGAPGMILFGGGLPDPALHPARELRELLAESLAGKNPSVLGYGHDQGDAGLRGLIADRGRRDGIAIPSEGIVVTNGSASGIGLVATALIEPGDVAVAEAATYPGALKAFRQMGAEIAAAPVDEGGLDPAALDEILSHLGREGRRVKFVYTIPTCHNPTASVLGLDRRRAILDLAARHGILVLEDNTYGQIRFGEVPPPMVALDSDHAIHLGSFSKTIAPGLRMGWIAARPDIAEAINRVRSDLGVSPLLQRTVARYLESGVFDTHLDEMTGHYRRKRDSMLSSLATHCSDIAEWSAPQGGFFLWLRLRRGEARAALDAGEEEQVSFMPGSYFAARPGTLTEHVRLSYGEVPEASIEEGIARLGRALGKVAA